MRRWRTGPTSGPLLAAAGGVAIMILFGLAVGQDYNYDLMNYHVASAHLLLAGALDRNVAPSGVQSWFNPIGYVPVYLAIMNLPPRLVAMLAAIGAGLNAPLIFLLAERVGGALPRPDRLRAAGLCTLIGMTGAITLSEAATSFLDNLLSLAELGALLCAMRALEARPASRLAAAGLLLGLATGLKLTVGIFAAAMALALLVPLARRRIALRAAAIFALAGTIGFLLTGGWWAWHLWSAYRNPVFPMANDLFRSAWIVARPLNDTSFQPQGWADIATAPWHWLIGDRTPGAEIAIRDPRYVTGLLAGAIVVALAVRPHADRSPEREAGLLLACFVLLSYLIWLFLFGILRYAVILEMLAAVLLLALLQAWPRASPKIGVAVLIAAALVAIGLTRTGSWGRAGFTADWFGVSGIAAVHRPGTLYVMPDDAPLGFMVALFPPDARFVHVGGNLPLDPATGLGRRAADMIGHAAILRTLAAAPDNAGGIATLRRFGLAEVPGSCRPIATKVAPAESCLLARVN